MGGEVFSASILMKFSNFCPCNPTFCYKYAISGSLFTRGGEIYGETTLKNLGGGEVFSVQSCRDYLKRSGKYWHKKILDKLQAVKKENVGETIAK